MKSPLKNYLPEFDAVFEYDYQPHEPSTHGLGCDESATITSVKVPALNNLEVLEMLEATDLGRDILRGYELEAMANEAESRGDDYGDRVDNGYQRMLEREQG